MRRLALTLLVLSASGCPRSHVLEDGVYTFSIKDVLRDDCGAAQQPAVVSKGTLVTTGDAMRIEYSFLDVQLVGTYLDLQEQITCDGTAVNVTTTVRNQECLLDTVAIHLTGKAIDSTHMEGSMSVTYDARTPDACVCQFWFTYRAVRSP